VVDIRGGKYVVAKVDLPRLVPLYAGDTLETLLVHEHRPIEVESHWVGGKLPAFTLAHSGAPIGQLGDPYIPFLAVKVPEQTVEHLAASVLLGEDCGPHLVDCLIEQQIFDLEGEFAKKVRKETAEEIAKWLGSHANRYYHDHRNLNADALASAAMEIRKEFGV
jgi:hypothetical protein